MTTRPCLAITLVNPREPQSSGSYLWCKRDDHEDELHECYSGIHWRTDDLVLPTPNMYTWRTGGVVGIQGVRGRMLG